MFLGRMCLGCKLLSCACEDDRWGNFKESPNTGLSLCRMSIGDERLCREGDREWLELGLSRPEELVKGSWGSVNGGDGARYLGGSGAFRFGGAVGKIGEARGDEVVVCGIVIRGTGWSEDE